MATNNHNEDIRLQAEHVVTVSKALRDAPKSADFTSDDFPFGLFAELLTQIKLRDGWLQPAEQSMRRRRRLKRSPSTPQRELANVKNIITEIDHLADNVGTLLEGA